MPEQTATEAPEPTSSVRRTPLASASTSLAEVIAMAQLRWQLAELEVQSDLASARRLGLTGGIGLLAAITALPVLTVVLAGQLDTLWATTFPWVTLSSGCLLLAGGLLTAWCGWRRFRGEFLGLRESLDECREDLIWLREMVDDRSGGEA